MKTLYALDIVQTTGPVSHWRRRNGLVRPQDSAARPASVNPELPRDGFNSPLGYWFATAESWTTAVPRLRVEFCELDERGQPNFSCDERSRDGASGCRTVRANLKTRSPGGRARTRPPSLPLTLQINHEMAKIGVDALTWESMGETVLLVVAQFWRFGAIDRALDELSGWAHYDLATNVGFRRMIDPRRARELRGAAEHSRY